MKAPLYAVCLAAPLLAAGCHQVLGIEDLSSEAAPGSESESDPPMSEAGGSGGSDDQSAGNGGAVPAGGGGSDGVESQTEEPIGEEPLSLGDAPDAGADAAPEPDPAISVGGRVVDFFRRPVPGQLVAIGERTALTDADGRFSFDQVEPPYDVAISLSYNRFGGINRYGYVYQGLTRSDPTLQVYRGLPQRDSNVMFEFPGVTLGTNEVVAFGFSSPDAEFYHSGLSGNTLALSMASWSGPTSIAGNVHALSFVRSGSFSGDPPLSFSSYQSGSFSATANQTINVSFDLPATEIATARVSGRVVPFQSVDRSDFVSVFFDDGTRLPLIDESNQSDEFDYLVPDLPGASIQVAVAEGIVAPLSIAHRDDVAPGTADIELEIPRPVTVVSPQRGSTIQLGESFRWSGLGQTASTYVWHLEFTDIYQGLFVITASEEIQLPTFPDGLGIPPGTSCYWSVETHGDQPDVDALAGPEGFFDAFAGDGEVGVGPRRGAGYHTESERHAVTMAP